MRVTTNFGSRQILVAAAFSAAAGMAAPALAQSNIIVNGGFESDSAGPTIPDAWNGTGYATRDTTNPHTGAAEELLNNANIGANNISVFQNTPNNSAVAGSVYTLNFYASGNTANDGQGQYQLGFFGPAGPLYFSGIQIMNVGQTTSVPNPSAYTLNTFVAPAAPAGTSYAEIYFYAVTGGDPGAIAQVYLDDVSLTSAAAVASGATAWNVATSGDWNVATNWTNGVPNAIDAEADFFGALTAPHTVYSDIPVTVGILNFNNPNQYVISGAGSLTMQTSTGSANIIVQAGTQKIDLPLIIASNTTINVSSGATLLVSNPVTIDAGTAVTTTPGGGTVSYQSYVTLGAGASLNLGGSTAAFALAEATGATTTVPVSTGTRSLFQTNSLNLSAGSTLNVNNNDLIVHGGSVASVTASIAAGYNHGSWTGTGITSGSAASNSSHLTALGVMPVTTAGTFDNAAVSPGDVIVRYTYYGDANLDGKVDGSDYSLIDAGYSADKAQAGSVSGWSNGDFNYDGTVDGSDYALIDNAFNNQTGTIAAGSAALVASSSAQTAPSAVPEPASVALLGAGAMSLVIRRRSGRESAARCPA